MTVPASAQKAGPFNCNGVVDDFDFEFKVFATSDVRVVRTSAAGLESTLTLITDYTVSLNGDQDADPGGSITTTSVYADGKITLVSNLSETQPTVLTNAGGFYPKVVERSLDRLAILIKQMREKLDRAVTVDVSSGVDPADLLDSIDDSVAAAAASEAAAAASETAAGLSETAAAASEVAAEASAAVAAAAGVIALTSVAGTNTITASAAGVTSYDTGRPFTFVPANTNGGATTLNVNALGAKNVYANGAACVGGELVAGVPYVVVYDGTRFGVTGPYVLLDGVARPSEVRQTVLTAKTNASGYADFIEAGTGLQAKRMCATVAGVFSFAAGYNSAGAANYIARVTTDDANAYGTLAASNTSFLHETYVDASTTTGGNCLIPPQYGYAFDKSENVLLRFQGADGSTSILDDFGNTWGCGGNAQIDTAQSKFGASSLLLDGTGDYASTNSITSFGDGSWEASLWFRINALPASNTIAFLCCALNAAQVGFGLALNNAAGTTKLALYVSSDASSMNVANGNLGVNTTWATGQWNKVRAVFDALAGTYRVYLSLNGAAESQEISVSSSARLCGITNVAVGGNPVGGNNFFNGWVDAFSFKRCASNTTTETPAAVAPTVTDTPVHFFSIPDMTMYEATAASVSAGTPPTLTARSRLFVGEADTDGSGVTAVRSYALRGQYVNDSASNTPLPAVGTSTNYNHNIGTRLVEATLFIECLTGNRGYAKGNRITGLMGFNGSYGYSITPNHGRNTVSWVTGTSAPGGGGATCFMDTVGAFNNAADASWKHGVIVRRTF